MHTAPQRMHFHYQIKHRPGSAKGRARAIVNSFIIVLAALFLAAPAHAARVQFQTFLGDFVVDIFDQDVPISSAAFLSSVGDGLYNESIIHRIENGSFIQGGGYTLNGDILEPIEKQGVARSEVLFSHVRGTLAYADPADLSTRARTVQWFININDNSDILDRQSGGYTVFGRVHDTDMAIVDAIAQLEKLNFEDFPDLPLRNYSEQSAFDSIPITYDNYAVIQLVTIIDEGSSTMVDLPPLISRASPTPSPTNPEKDKLIEGIGSVGVDAIWALLGLAILRRRSTAADIALSWCKSARSETPQT